MGLNVSGSPGVSNHRPAARQCTASRHRFAPGETTQRFHRPAQRLRRDRRSPCHPSTARADRDVAGEKVGKQRGLRATCVRMASTSVRRAMTFRRGRDRPSGTARRGQARWQALSDRRRVELGRRRMIATGNTATHPGELVDPRGESGRARARAAILSAARAPGYDADRCRLQPAAESKERVAIRPGAGASGGSVSPSECRSCRGCAPPSRASRARVAPVPDGSKGPTEGLRCCRGVALHLARAGTLPRHQRDAVDGPHRR